MEITVFVAGKIIGLWDVWPATRCFLIDPLPSKESFVSKGRISRGGTFERARTDPFSNLLFSKPSLETVMVVVIVVVSVEKKKRRE